MSNSLIRKTGTTGKQLDITPESADWRFLSFAVITLQPGETYVETRPGQETAVVPLSGHGTLRLDDQSWSIGRDSVFTDMPSIGYAPPGVEIEVTARASERSGSAIAGGSAEQAERSGPAIAGGSAEQAERSGPAIAGGSAAFEFAIGSAPAEGKYPIRLFTPEDMKSEVRGGGAAHRQVNHVLAPPLPAERLILYEVYVPRGTWSGWAPHRHDGVDGAPYLEETYYFRLDPGDGFAMHRNWAPEAEFDETIVLHDGDCALVPKGYHSSVACPSSNMFFLNYLAGELLDEERITPPCFHEAYTWIQDDWSAGEWTQPVIDAPNLGKS